LGEGGCRRSSFRRRRSIQPKHSASSTLWGQVIEGLPLSFFQKPTDSSGAVSWFSSSQARH